MSRNDVDNDARARLDQFRGELGAIDREILTLVAKRQAKAIEIGQTKRELGLPTRDFRQEKDVVQRARKAAGDQGLPESLGEELVLALHPRVADRAGARPDREGRRGLGPARARDRRRGPHGRVVRALPARAGFTVEIADPAEGQEGVVNHRDWKRAKLDHELIVIAAPMPATNQILKDARSSAAGGCGVRCRLAEVAAARGPARAARRRWSACARSTRCSVPTPRCSAAAT